MTTLIKDIYIIKCKDPDIDRCYVGQTGNYPNRCKQHKYHSSFNGSAAYHRPIYQYIRDNGGFSNFKIDILQTVEAEQKTIDKVEAFYIRKFKSLNYQIPARTRKQYHIDNRQKLNSASNQYYYANREILTEKKKESFLCSCGSTYTRSHKARHLKSDKHLNSIHQV